MARYTTGPRLWTDPATGIHYVRFRYRGRDIFESTGTRNLGEAQAQANLTFAEVVSGRRAATGPAVAATSAAGATSAIATTAPTTTAPTRQLIVLGAVWLEEVESELSEATRDQYEMYLGSHLGPFFKTIDRVTSESAMDYRCARLRVVQRPTLLKELSCLRGFMNCARARSTLPRSR